MDSSVQRHDGSEPRGQVMTTTQCAACGGPNEVQALACAWCCNVLSVQAHVRVQVQQPVPAWVTANEVRAAYLVHQPEPTRK